MAATNYFEFVIDPDTGAQLEVKDKYAREQLVHKTEKTVVNSLPSKPTNQAQWLEMEKFIYYVPVADQRDTYEAWTLFFIGDPSVASDYTDTDNYSWAQLAYTQSDLNNFSTKGHTHQVNTDVVVGDHDYTPEGQVVGAFAGLEGTTSNNTHNHSFTPHGTVTGSFSGQQADTGDNTHNHQFTPHGSVSGDFSGDQGTTDSGYASINFSKDGKKLTTKKLNVTPVTAVDTSGSTKADRVTGELEADGGYNAGTSVFNGITCTDGVLRFVTKKMTKVTNGVITGVSATVDASKVVVGTNGTDVSQDMATGEVESGSQLVGHNASVSDSGHTHTYTPSGDLVNMSFTGDKEGTENHTHHHSYTPSGSLQNLAFSGQTEDTVDNTHNHTLTPAGRLVLGFKGVRANLHHAVDNKPVRTSPDNEDEGSHVFDWYGIRYDEDASSRFKERIGNMDMHRTLPIQTKMRRCILNDDGEVEYYLDSNDSTKRAGSQEGYVTSEETFMSKVETDEIRDETEEIGVIKGNTGELNQILSEIDGSYTSDIGDGIVYTVSHGRISISGTATATSQLNLTETATSSLVVGHKYFVFLSKTLQSGVTINLNGIEASPTVSFDDKSIFTITQTGSSSYIKLRIQSGTQVSDSFYVYVIDLTLMGIDSFTTVEQVEAYLAQNFGQRSYYPYNPGTLLSNTMQGIQTVGFNKWDEQWFLTDRTYVTSENPIPVVGGRDYYFGCLSYSGNVSVVFLDSSKNAISSSTVYANNTFSTPADCAYITFLTGSAYGTTYNHDICINISDPAKNGTYEPYNLHSYQRDVTQITGINPNTGVRELVAPNGLQKADMAGTVIDSIYNDVNGNAVCKKMCGDVDLGDCNWINASYIGTGVFNTTDIGNGIRRAICGKYSSKYADSISYMTNDKSLYYGHSTTGIVIKDTQYESYTASNFKKAMEGVHFVYELATPILYTDLQWGDGSPVILPIEIEAEKNSTIKIVPPHGDGGEELLMAAPTLQMKKYVLTQGANLDGSDGQVMVEIPEHWRRVERITEGNTTYVYAKISPYPQVGWHHVGKNYVAAFEATIIDEKLASTSYIEPYDLSTPIWSVDADGKINVTCDLTKSRKPTTVKSGATLNVDGFRAFARARNDARTAEWNGQTWMQWVDVTWLFFIEYACTNTQEPVKFNRDSNGFMQGGLGVGVSTWDGNVPGTSTNAWAQYNNYYPIVPCGVTAVLGNKSGEVILNINGGGTITGFSDAQKKLRVPTYRGIENPFGHIWMLCDGIKYSGTDIYRCNNPRDFSNAEGTTGYTLVGTKCGSNGIVKTVLIQPSNGYNEQFDGDLTPVTVHSGGYTQYYCDYYWQASGWRACLLGGVANDGAYDGFVYVRSASGLGLAYRDYGSRLCFLPESV